MKKKIPYKPISRTLMHIYHQLHQHYGNQNWWPADTQCEMIIGAILTQSTAWKNVEKALANLKQAKLLNWKSLVSVDEKRLAGLIRSSGYFNAKAKKLKSFVTFLYDRYQGSLKKMFATPLPELRNELLTVYGIGEETADSILLYAGNQPSFVIDAYTRRIFSRLGIVRPTPKTYHTWQQLFMQHLPLDAKLFNEYHALIVAFGKEHCTEQVKCDICLLKDFCQYPESREFPTIYLNHKGR